MTSCKEPVYTTRLGRAYCADSLDFLKTLSADSIDLVVTSPPYALHFKKEYGNANQDKSSPLWAEAEWARCIAHAIRHWAVMSR